MEQCALEALEEGASVFGMQWPQGGNGETAQCFFGDKGVMTDDPEDKYGKRDDSECKAEEWSPTFRNQTFTYHGSGWHLHARVHDGVDVYFAVGHLDAPAVGDRGTLALTPGHCQVVVPRR